MQSFVFSHKYLIIDALALNEQQLLLISDQGIHIFSIANTQEICFRQFPSELKNISPIRALQSRHSPNNFIIQGKLGLWVLCTVSKSQYKGKQNLHVQFIKQYTSFMRGFLKTNFITIMRIKKNTPKNNISYHVQANKQTNEPPKSLLGIALSKKNEKESQTKQSFKNEIQQILFVLDCQNKSLQLLNFQLECVKNYQIPESVPKILQSTCCACISQNNNQKYIVDLYLGQEGCNINKISLPYIESDQILISEALHIQTKQQLQIIMSMQIIDQSKSEEPHKKLMVCSVRKQPYIYVIGEVLKQKSDQNNPSLYILSKVSLQFGNFPLKSIGNITALGQSLVFTNCNEIYILKNFNIQYKIVVNQILVPKKICQLKQSKSIGNMNLSKLVTQKTKIGNKKNYIITGCTEEKQFVYLQLVL